MVHIPCRQEDRLEPFDVIEGAGPLQTEGRKGGEDIPAGKKKARVVERDIEADLGNQLGDEKDAVIGTGSRIDVRGGEYVGLGRIREFGLRSFLSHGERQFLRYELKHGIYEKGLILKRPVRDEKGWQRQNIMQES
jgi:hypothetical protein